MGILSLIRIALFVLLAWWLYKGIKRFIAVRVANKPNPNKSLDPETGQEIEMMVQDPQCGTYLPSKDAVWIHHHGEDLYFCSQSCRDEYLAAKK
jgi:uncharacterized protein